MMHIFYCNALGDPTLGVEHVCAIESDDLEVIFREMNVVDGSEIPISLGRRSLCIGDIAMDFYGKYAYRCAGAGWEEIDLLDAQRMRKQVPRDFRVFYPRCGTSVEPFGLSETEKRHVQEWLDDLATCDNYKE